MHKGKYVFAQLLDFIDKDVFLRIANKYGGNRYVKQFTCWNQLAVLMFGQLSNCESLRDVVLDFFMNIWHNRATSGTWPGSVELK